jgi:hypothetical protein
MSMATNENELVKAVNTVLKSGVQDGNKTSLAVSSKSPDYDENYMYFLDVIRLERDIEAEQLKASRAQKDLDIALETINKLSNFSSRALKEENAQLRRAAETNIQALNDIRTMYDARMKTYTQIVSKLQKELDASKAEVEGLSAMLTSVSTPRDNID